jgi:hypothetical protein
VEHKGIPMTPVQKVMIAHAAGVCADENLAKRLEQSLHIEEACIESPDDTPMLGSPPTTSANEPSALKVFEEPSAPGPNERSAFPFFDLPFEIRQTILFHIFPSSTMAVFLHRTKAGPATGIPFPPIASVSKRLRAEALCVALKQTEFEIHSGAGNLAFATWLRDLDFSPLHGDISSHVRNGLDRVQKLSFPKFSRFPFWKAKDDTPNYDVELMKKCGNLQQVELYFTPGDLNDNSSWSAHRLKTPAQLVATLHMAEVLQVKVEKIVLLGYVQKGFKDWEENGIMGLKQWLVDGYKNLGREVDVSVIES